MRISLNINERPCRIDLSRPIDISIPVVFEGQQFRAFGASPAHSQPYRSGDVVLSTDKGAGCNCPVFHFSAHLHGTHTECVGHISQQNYIVQDLCEPPCFISAVLVSLTPVAGSECRESYQPSIAASDSVLTRQDLVESLEPFQRPFDALVVRTLPNPPNKRYRNYDSFPSSYFSNEAMVYIRDLGVKFLLVDTVSVDRSEDEGRLSNHHIFWEVEQGSHDVQKPSQRTITEFIYVPAEIQDGEYVLTMNIANIRSDAAPSRPVLYEVNRP